MKCHVPTREEPLMSRARRQKRKNGPGSTRRQFLTGMASALTGAVEAVRRKITTIEGLASDEKLHPVQAAFVEKDGLQCGFCTPGQVMASVALLASNPDPSPEEIRAGLAGNTCRCGAYPKIFEAVADAAARMKKQRA